MTIKLKIDKVEFRTNDVTENNLTDAYKNALNNKINVLTRNTKINDLNLNSDGTLQIDLNKEFLKETNVKNVYFGKRGGIFKSK